MCRHLAWTGRPATLAELVVQPAGGLYEQSWSPRRQRYGTVNADGFGLGWYPEDSTVGETLPARYRRAVPIWADPNLPDLARTLHSDTVVAAVRDATPGTAQDETAAAPYAAGPWLFSHNGAVPAWQQLPADLGVTMDERELLTLEARCDSALLWALLLRGLRSGRSPQDALAGLVCSTRAARPGVRLNFLLTGRRRLFATRCGDTLWYRATDSGVLVASEPDERDGWQEVPDETLLAAGPSGARLIPLFTSGTGPARSEYVPAVPSTASERNPTA